MAAENNFKNMVLCLFLVCLFCGAILGSVYAVTKKPIEEAAIAEARAAIAEVLPAGGEISEPLKSGEMEYYLSRSGENINAYAVKSSAVGFGGPLTLMVGVLPDGTIYNTKVLSHSETPGLGAKCDSDAHFIAQWKEFPANGNITLKKDGGDIDAITASTITSRAYSLAVQNARNLVKSLQHK
ncbi:MAG TPA: RnfABCDGE type electron transport complex subunit G, partial [Candidatus Cryptobacteroides sp.]|nr:RnfABCDGE type electron transport complex subunit G [Candidatus Cryptobacteroides sp.]